MFHEADKQYQEDFYKFNQIVSAFNRSLKDIKANEIIKIDWVFEDHGCHFDILLDIDFKNLNTTKKYPNDYSLLAEFYEDYVEDYYIHMEKSDLSNIKDLLLIMLYKIYLQLDATDVDKITNQSAYLKDLAVDLYKELMEEIKNIVSKLIDEADKINTEELQGLYELNLLMD